MRLSITGEKQRVCVEELLKTLPTVTTHTSNKRAKFSCDRGYTNEAFLAQRALKLFNAISINNAAARNPFISSEQLEEWIEGCRGKKLFQVLDSNGKPMKDADGKIKLNQEKVEQCTAIMEEQLLEQEPVKFMQGRLNYKLIPQKNLYMILTRRRMLRRRRRRVRVSRIQTDL